LSNNAGLNKLVFNQNFVLILISENNFIFTIFQITKNLVI